jgi:cytochrome P450
MPMVETRIHPILDLDRPPRRIPMTIDTIPTSVPSVFDAGLPSLDYLQVQDPEDAHRAISDARRQAPIALGALGPEVLTYDLVRTVLRDPRFAAAWRHGAEAQGITAGPLWQRITSLILSLDGERHQRQRRLVAKAFTPRATARLQHMMVETITELLDAHVPLGRCDVVCDVAERFPIPVICALLGTPRHDWQLFSDWVTDIKKVFDWNLAADQPSILSAWQALDEYLEDMVASRRHTLTDDLISELIHAEDDGQKLDHDELLSLVVALLGGGTDTTRHQLAAAVDLFCDHPDQWALLGEQPDLVPRAVEEAMRYRPIGFALPRIATEDLELAGGPHPGRNDRVCQHRSRQPRPSSLQRSRPIRYHPRQHGRHAELRQRRALLLGLTPGPARAHSSPDRDGPAHAQPAPYRPSPVAVDDRSHRT